MLGTQAFDLPEQPGLCLIELLRRQHAGIAELSQFHELVSDVDKRSDLRRSSVLSGVAAKRRMSPYPGFDLLGRTVVDSAGGKLGAAALHHDYLLQGARAVPPVLLGCLTN